MAQDSKIEWTTHTFNPWRGCTKVAEGCKNCYADSLSKRNPKTLGIWGPNGTRVVAAEPAWREPLKWNKEAIAWPLHVELCRQSNIADPVEAWTAQDDGNPPDPEIMERPRVFCASMADVFEDWDGPMVDHHGEQITICDNCLDRQQCQDPDIGCQQRPYTMADARERLFRLIDATPNLDWLLVTKRPENIRKMWLPSCSTCYGDGFYQPSGQEEMYNCPECYGSPGFRKNVWLLTSIACQEDADRNIPELLKCRDLVPVLGVSAEPLIGPVTLTEIGNSTAGIHRPDGSYRPLLRYDALRGCEDPPYQSYGALNWVIAGGESGPNARPYDIAWPREIIAQCREAGVPCFHKQLGARVRCASVSDFPAGTKMRCPGHEADPSELYAPILADKKGGDPAEWPEDLRVREFPAAT